MDMRIGEHRDGGVLLMASRFGLYPFLLKLYADGGYQGPRFCDGLARVCRQVRVEIVRRSDTGRFVMLPKRWIVKRTIAWLNRCRRLAKDWECMNQMPLRSCNGSRSGSWSESSAKAQYDLGWTLRRPFIKWPKRTALQSLGQTEAAWTVAANSGLAEDRSGSRNAGRKEESRAMAEAENSCPETSDVEAKILDLRLLLLDLEGERKSKLIQITILVTILLSGLVTILFLHLREGGLSFLVVPILFLIYWVYEEISTLISLETSLKKAGILLDAARKQMGRKCANRWSEDGVNKETEAPTSQQTVSNASSCPAVP